MLSIDTFAEVVAAAGSAVLLLAGTRKLGSPHALTETVRKLGFPYRYSWWAVTGLGVAEVGASVGLILWRSLFVSVIIALLAVLFAGAGIVARFHSLDLECHCLGVGTSRLGFRQLWALLLWAPVVLLPTIDQYIIASLELRFASLIIVIVTVLAINLRRLLTIAWETRKIRLESELL